MPESLLLEVLEESRTLGFLGPGPPEAHLRHALAMARVVERHRGRPARFLDAGTGGGVPGLVLLEAWPATRGILLDAARRRCAAVRAWVERLGWTDRAEVVEGRGEELARTGLRADLEIVAARSFAVPAVTAEIAGAFVAPGGLLVVSEPPSGTAPETAPQSTGTERWPAPALAGLGLALVGVEAAGDATFAVLERVGPLPDRYPRRTGVPAKRPLWR